MNCNICFVAAMKNNNNNNNHQNHCQVLTKHVSCTPHWFILIHMLTSTTMPLLSLSFLTKPTFMLKGRPLHLILKYACHVLKNKSTKYFNNTSNSEAVRVCRMPLMDLIPSLTVEFHCHKINIVNKHINCDEWNQTLLKLPRVYKLLEEGKGKR